MTIEARVRVTRAFKGKTGRVVRVRGNTNGATCGIGITLRELLRATRGKWRSPA